MTSDLTTHEPGAVGDDGFNSSNSNRATAAYLKWTDTLGWHDRDGCKPPSPLLVWKMAEFAGSWQDRQLLKEPLSKLEQLNAAVPESELERDQNGKPIPRWKHFVGIYFIDPATGKGFRYEHSTWGARKMADELSESVTNMRILRGSTCLPLVQPAEKPWKLDTGLRKRPVLDIINFKTFGGNAQAVPAKPVTPQLSGPTVAPVETPPTAPATPPPTTPPPTTPSPASNPAQPYQAKPKPPVQLAAETLTAMSDVKPVTTSEILDDEVPF
jgi:hypothetical protein